MGHFCVQSLAPVVKYCKDVQEYGAQTKKMAQPREEPRHVVKGFIFNLS